MWGVWEPKEIWTCMYLRLILLQTYHQLSVSPRGGSSVGCTCHKVCQADCGGHVKGFSARATPLFQGAISPPSLLFCRSYSAGPWGRWSLGSRLTGDTVWRHGPAGYSTCPEKTRSLTWLISSTKQNKACCEDGQTDGRTHTHLCMCVYKSYYVIFSLKWSLLNNQVLTVDSMFMSSRSIYCVSTKESLTFWRLIWHILMIQRYNICLQWVCFHPKHRPAHYMSNTLFCSFKRQDLSRRLI